MCFGFVWFIYLLERVLLERGLLLTLLTEPLPLPERLALLLITLPDDPLALLLITLPAELLTRLCLALLPRRLTAPPEDLDLASTHCIGKRKNVSSLFTGAASLQKLEVLLFA